MRSVIVVTIFAAAATLAGCASSQQLSQRADAHMSNARGAYETGNYQMAKAEQRKSEKDYQRAASRARDEGREPPPPPASPPLPVFDPQMER